MADGDAYVGNGLVKEVQSGDCLTILVRSGGGGAATELQLTLASLEAPRINRRNGDAPFAQQAREFLRARCAGQMVTFKVEYKVASINRTFGTVIVDGEDLSHAVVEAGFATVKEARGAETSGSYDELVALQEMAKAAGRGIHTSDAKKIAAASVKVRSAGDPDVSDDELAAIFKQIEDKPVEAIVECVIVTESPELLEWRSCFSVVAAAAAAVLFLSALLCVVSSILDRRLQNGPAF
jgi:staphylococcal nuclease domain-containing protein 1